ncbi:MAG: hypothetical protein JRI97_05935 [Deltaproteobacteria bacterium]|nr:hypothetical protein [Deltaproteobacteria bacterium]
MDFKGLDDWVEIFAGGPQTDSAGRTHDGDVLIDRALASFDPARHEPPLVVGHPVHDAPAYGWVRELRADVRNGVRVLLARFRQVAPQLAKLVAAGAYKKRSAAFYPDGALRHVGFLGAAPPAVKGLADVAFAGPPDPVFLFLETPTRGEDMSVKDRLKTWFARAVDELPEAELSPAFSEADLARAREEAAAAARAQALAEQAKEDKRTKIRSVVDAGLAAGRILPAWCAAGLSSFMEALPEGPEAGFAGCGKSPFVWFCEFLGSLPRSVPLDEETVTAAADPAPSGDPGAALAALVRARLARDPGKTYAAAFAEVRAENPGLAAEYAAEILSESRG